MGYSGQTVTIRLGDAGLDTNPNPARIPGHHLIVAQGVVFTDDCVRKEPGTLLFGTVTTGLAPVLGLLDWWPTETVQRLLSFMSDGKVYQTTAAAPSDPDAVASTNAATGAVRGRLVVGGAETAGRRRKVFIFTGIAPVLVVDNAATPDTVNDHFLATPPADWTGQVQPVNGVVHHGRLWGLLRYNVYYSTLGDHENFTGAGSGIMPVHPGVGSALYAGVSYNGLLWVGKYPRGLYWIDDSSPDDTQWAAQQLTDAIGVAASPHAMLAIDDDVLILTPEAQIHRLSRLLAAQKQGGPPPVAYSDVLGIREFLRDTVNRANLAQAVSVYDPETRQAIFGLPMTGQTQNVIRLVLDFAGVPRGEPVRVSWSTRDSVSAIALRRGIDQIDRPMVGNYAADIHILNQLARSREGTGNYRSQFQTPHDDFGWADPKLKSARKNFDSLDIEYVAINHAMLSGKTYLDGRYYQAFNAELEPAGAAIGTFVIGTDAIAGTAIRSVSVRLGGNARRFSVLLSNALANEDYQLTELSINFRPAGDEARA